MYDVKSTSFFIYIIKTISKIPTMSINKNKKKSKVKKGHINDRINTQSKQRVAPKKSREKRQLPLDPEKQVG